MSEVESINPNTPVTSNLNAEGKIEADATGGPLSFDELEELTMKSKSKKAEKKEEATEKPKKEKDLASDDQKGDKKPEQKAEKKPEADKKEAKAEEAEEKPPRKTVKAKYNETELDLDEESLIPVKINGKEEMVQVKDLLGNYSGKVAYDKKFSELDLQRKNQASKELKLGQIEKTIKETLEEQDPEMRIYRLAQLANVDPIEFRQKFYSGNIPLLEKYQLMSDDERKADDLAFQAKVHKHRADTLEKSIKEKQAYDALSSRVNQLRERHQVSEQDFVQKFDYLEKYNQNLIQKGQQPIQLSPEIIVKEIALDRLWTPAEEKFDSLNLGVPDDVKRERLNWLVEQAYSKGHKPSDMADEVDNLWGIKKAQKKVEEKLKSNEEFLSGKKEVPQVRRKPDEAMFFDEM